MKTFLGIGLGPIQVSIFLDGAFRGGFERLVIADVDAKLIEFIRANEGTIQFNIASNKQIITKTITGIEIYSPEIPEDAEKLVQVASAASEIATALPSVAFYRHLGWLKSGFQSAPRQRRIVYAAENHNRAAEELENAVGCFENTCYLNTVIGKMSCIVPAEEVAARGILALTPEADRGHLVEQFNKILVQSSDQIDARMVQGLHAKPALLPFEEAKLYGHNAVHFWLGLRAQQLGARFMHEVADDTELLEIARRAFVNESGAALCKKWAGVDDLFTDSGYAAYADDLLERMLNPYLTDRVDRVCRDLERKLGWDDRAIGTLRVALNQDVQPILFAEGAARAARILYGNDPELIRKGLESLWAHWDDEAERVWSIIKETLA